MSNAAKNVLLQQSPVKRFGVADAVLAALVIGVVGLMIIPLPTWLLDLLIAANLAISVTVLLVTLYVTDALKIAAFPSLLLLTTLVRLALNVSSTRLILLQADAGEMISAFGNFVVRGNYVVGAVIFLILSIIQFVVIAKGSERVAEVGARFTLDAMPGKQMAIDAELRSGGIDGNEAKQRRRHLARESQFYGAMDGAMKFVKGDVIASFIMTLINIFGGLAIGMGQRNMAAVDALKKYGLLTIGDGLVSQIPALVLSTAAGILVTRVASEQENSALGAELGAQLLQNPKSLAVASFFIGGLGLVPGLPMVPLFAIGGALFMLSRFPRKKDTTEEGVGTPAPPAQRDAAGQRTNRFVPVLVPWSLQVSSDLVVFIEDEQKGDRIIRPGIKAATGAVRELLFRDLGVPLPACVVQVNDDLPPRHLLLSLFEVPATGFALAAELEDRDLAQNVVDRVLPVFRKRAADYLGIAEAQVLLDKLEQIAPATVRQTTPKPVSLPLLTDILRRLVEEGVSVRDLKGILESLAQVATADKDPLNLAEYARSQMRRALTFEATGGTGAVSAILLSSDIEEAVRGAISRTSAGSFLTLAPAAARDVVKAVRRAVEQAAGVSAQVVVVTQPDIRRFVRKLIENDLPWLRVLSYSELLPEVSVKPAATATIRNL
jgi:type III secretion protein V